MKKFIVAIGIIFGLTMIPAGAMAAKVDILPSRVCNGAPNSAACKDSQAGKSGSPLYGPNGVITVLINILSILVGIAAVFGIILGGMKLITSGNNPQEVTKGREFILYALIGLVVTAFAQILVRFFLAKIST